MLLTDSDIIEKLKIKPTDRVLDIGGSMMQHREIKIDTLADIIRPEEAPYGSSKLLAKKFVKVDITRGKLPFKDNEFDVVLCTHVLEDLPSPFLAMDEISRVAKRGLIVTPSMGIDMKFSPIDYTDWLTGARRVPGEAHHKWFFVKEGDSLKVIPKNYPILYTEDFQVTGWMGEAEMKYYWKGIIKYSEFSSLNIHKLIDEYK
jgi:ubiquinone/menaquinone biosynthesis C-methylase UbiE